MKKILFLLSLILFTLTSCNQLIESEYSDVTVSGGQILSRQVVDGYDENARYSITFEMSGDYTEQITKSGTIEELKSQNFSFKDLAVGSKVKFKCTLYYHDGTSGGRAIWSGESDEVVIAEGANNVSIKMKKLFDEIVIFNRAAFMADLEANYSDKVTFGERDGAKVIKSCDLEKYAIPYGYKKIESDGQGSVFMDCEKLKTIIIPDSIEELGDGAFGSCTSLENISLPDSITTIGTDAFGGCVSLTSIVIPDRVTSIGEYTFYNCEKLKDIVIPDGVTEIGSNAFNGCSALETLNLPKKITSISSGMFQDSGLTSIVIPESVTEIEDSAFYGCTNLETVMLPKPKNSGELITLGSDVFKYRDSNSRKDMVLPKLKIYVPYGNGVNGNGGTEPYYQMYRGSSSYNTIIHTLFTSNDVPRNLSKYYTVPAGYTVIAANAFEGRTVLEGVTVSAEVEFIEADAFLNCTNLQAVALKRYEEYSFTPITKAVVKEYGADPDAPDSFKGCHNDLNIYVPCTYDNYYNDFSNFYKDYYLNTDCNIAFGILDSDALTNGFIPGFTPGTSTECNIPYGYTAIADGTYNTLNDTTTGVFSEFTALTTVTLPESLETIGAWAFYKCTSLSDFTIPSSVTLINEGAFSYCSNLVSVELSNNLTSIAAKTFDNCRELTDVNIPDGVISIGEKAFNLCVKLESVKIKIPKTIKTIGGEAFYGCSSLTSITIPSSVINLGSSSDNDGAFAYCTGLTEVTIENGVETIGKKAFRACSNLESIDIPASVIQIGEDAFYNCSNLKYVYMLSKTPATLGSSAFGNTSIKAIYVPAGGDGIGGYDSYQQVYWHDKSWGTYGDKLQVLLSKAELATINSNYKNATTIVIPDDKYYTVIASDAFSECSNLTTLKIPSSVQRIEKGSFANCRSLNNVTLGGNYDWRVNDNGVPSDIIMKWDEINNTGFLSYGNPSTLLSESDIANYLKDDFANYEWITFN